MFLIPTRKRGHLEYSIHKNSGLKVSKYKADTFDMIQHLLEENKMAKTTDYRCVKKGKGAMAKQGNVWAGKTHKTPQTVDKIESFSDQIRKAF